MLKQKRLKEVLHYSPKSGLFINLVDRGRGGRAGTFVAQPRPDGYVRIQIDGVQFYAHQLAWLYCYGILPKQLDHKNGKPQDNRIKNLRVSTQQQNCFNSARQKNNRIGFKGVSLHKSSGLYRAQIWRDSKKYHLGYFRSPKKAYAAYLKKSKALFGVFASVR